MRYRDDSQFLPHCGSDARETTTPRCGVGALDVTARRAFIVGALRGVTDGNGLLRIATAFTFIVTLSP